MRQKIFSEAMNDRTLKAISLYQKGLTEQKISKDTVSQFKDLYIVQKLYDHA